MIRELMPTTMTPTLSNPYLDIIKTLDWLGESTMRTTLVAKYAWAIPNEEAIAKLVSLSPIIEIGAGAGYWASLVQEAGGVILPFDKEPYQNELVNGCWTKVYQGDETVLKDYPEHTLFLCWPSWDSDMAYNTLMNYQGDTLVYVGEGWGGCTANDAFYQLLENKWSEVEEIEIPHYSFARDYMGVYKRIL